MNFVDVRMFFMPIVLCCMVFILVFLVFIYFLINVQKSLLIRDCKVGRVRFTDSYRNIRMNIYNVVASMTEVCIG